MEQNATILDIGSSKVVCLIGGSGEGNRLTVYGAGIVEYEGFKKGKFLSEPGFVNAVATAIDAAQTEAKRRVRKVIVGVPGEFIINKLSKVELAVAAKDGRITENDIEALIDESLNFDHPEGYSIIHSTPLQFEADGAVRTETPVGGEAKNIGATVSHIFVNDDFTALVSSAFSELGVKLELLVAQPLALSLFLVPVQARQLPAVVLDVGYWNTDISIVRGNALAFHKTLGVGGAHFASDIAYGLGVPNAAAEPIKRRYVFGLAYDGSVENIRLTDGTFMDIEQETVQYIIEERAKEFCALLLRTLSESGELAETETPVYLTGGGLAMMRGSGEFLQSAIGMNVIFDQPHAPRLGSPNYSSSYSILDFVVHGMRMDGRGGSVLKALLNFFSK